MLQLQLQIEGKFINICSSEARGVPWRVGVLLFQVTGVQCSAATGRIERSTGKSRQELPAEGVSWHALEGSESPQATTHPTKVCKAQATNVKNKKRCHGLCLISVGVGAAGAHFQRCCQTTHAVCMATGLWRDNGVKSVAHHLQTCLFLPSPPVITGVKGRQHGGRQCSQETGVE